MPDVLPPASLPEALRPLGRARLQAEPPLPCRGLQRLELGGPGCTLTIAAGLHADDRRRLLAWFAPVDAVGQAPRPHPRPDTCLVVGAGLAGLAVAGALRRRGIDVVLVDAADRPGGALADIPLAAQHPALSADDNGRSRLARAAMMLSRRQHDRYHGAMQWCGRWQPVVDPKRRDRLLLGWPPALAAADDTGIGFPGCGLLDTAGWFSRVVALPGIRWCPRTRVTGLSRDGDRWFAATAGTTAATIGPFDAVVIACPQHAALSGLSPPWTPAGDLSPGRAAGGRLAGEAAPAGNLARIRGASGERAGDYRLEWPPWIVTGELSLAAGAAVGSPVRWRLSEAAPRLDPPDHLPMIGPVPHQAAVVAAASRHHRNDRLPYPMLPGLHLLTGLGGRGLLWSHLGAEMIAAELAGEPPIVEASLATAVGPGRFLRRHLRRTAVADTDIESRAGSGGCG